MALQGQCNVAASSCSNVIQIVSRFIFGKHFDIKNLPSVSSALNFADEAHHVAKHHIAEKLLKSKHFTLGIDGTSRQKKHYVERHVVLDNKKVMSVGFIEVACDDAKTLLEQTVDMFEEISNLYATFHDSCNSDVFKQIISKLKCIMSDRAAVMKLFDRQMAEYKKDLLQDQEASTHFLFCNAHFLLGIAKAAEEGIKEVEEALKETKGRLGRDLDGAYSSFSTNNESVAVRLVRTTTEVLGPRGDEKNGCREEWLA